MAKSFLQRPQAVKENNQKRKIIDVVLKTVNILLITIYIGKQE